MPRSTRNPNDDFVRHATHTNPKFATPKALECKAQIVEACRLFYPEFEWTPEGLKTLLAMRFPLALVQQLDFINPQLELGNLTSKADRITFVFPTIGSRMLQPHQPAPITDKIPCPCVDGLADVSLQLALEMFPKLPQVKAKLVIKPCPIGDVCPHDLKSRLKRLAVTKRDFCTLMNLNSELTAKQILRTWPRLEQYRKIHKTLAFTIMSILAGRKEQQLYFPVSISWGFLPQLRAHLESLTKREWLVKLRESNEEFQQRVLEYLAKKDVILNEFGCLDLRHQIYAPLKLDHKGICCDGHAVLVSLLGPEFSLQEFPLELSKEVANTITEQDFQQLSCIGVILQDGRLHVDPEGRQLDCWNDFFCG